MPRKRAAATTYVLTVYRKSRTPHKRFTAEGTAEEVRAAALLLGLWEGGRRVTIRASVGRSYLPPVDMASAAVSVEGSEAGAETAPASIPSSEPGGERRPLGRRRSRRP